MSTPAAVEAMLRATAPGTGGPCRNGTTDSGATDDGATEPHHEDAADDADSREDR
jgi:hypothetical protein